MWRSVAYVLVALYVTFSVAPAAAQGGMCAAREDVLAAAESRYGEVLAAQGMSEAGIMVELLLNPETGSFTLLGTRPDGMSCIGPTGDVWLTVTQEPKGSPS